MRARTFLLATTVLAIVATASAHPAGLADGYVRMVGDCIDDLGHDPPEGIDLVAIDVREASQGGAPVFLVRITYGPADPVPARIDLAFATPLNNGGDAVMTTIALDKGKPSHIDGTQPVSMTGGLPVADTTGRIDQERVATELAYTHAQLRAEKGHAVYNFEATAWRNDTTVGDWVRGDYIAGGYYNNGVLEGMCVYGAEDGFHAAPNGYTVQMDAWSRDLGSGGASEEDADNPPYADFTYVPAAPAAGADVAFTDRSTDDGSVRSWSWDFGDGTTSADSEASHRYDKPGSYIVTLTVIDDDGQFTTTSRTVNVIAAASKDSPGVAPILAALAFAGLVAVVRRRVV